MKKYRVHVLIISAFLITIPYAISNQSPPAQSDNSPLVFNIQTVALCENLANSVYCHDELLVNCEGEEYVLPKTSDSIKCGDVELDAPSITAFAVFEKDWEDPRY